MEQKCEKRIKAIQPVGLVRQVHSAAHQPAQPASALPLPTAPPPTPWRHRRGARRRAAARWPLARRYCALLAVKYAPTDAGDKP